MEDKIKSEEIPTDPEHFIEPTPEDYHLKLLSEANGMTLLVSERGQVFWVKKTKHGEELVSLNLGKDLTLQGFKSSFFK